MSTTPPAKKAGKTQSRVKCEQSNEFTLMSTLKPGGVARLQKLLADGFTGDRQKNTDRIGTVHDLRFATFDNETRFPFASTYDGDRDAHMDDVATIIPDELGLLFSEFLGYPGARNPNFRDWLVKNQVEAVGFYRAYPHASVPDGWEALKCKRALD
jgi:hypothetical protein